MPAALPGSAAAAAPRACYEPTWPSVDRHTAAPEWFQDAKFGVYWQWSITDTGTNIFVIANRATGLVLDSGGNVASGSPLKLWTDDGSPNLRWGFSVV